MQKHADVSALTSRHVEGSAMAMYEIRVKGHLDQRWSAWFDGLTVTHLADGDTMLAGPVVDQAALHSLLSKIHNLNLTLISVARKEESR